MRDPRDLTARDNEAVLRRAIDAAELSPRERTMLAMRFGLDGNGGLSVARIAGVFKLSGERVRVLVNRALWKLKRVDAIGVYEVVHAGPRCLRDTGPAGNRNGILSDV